MHYTAYSLNGTWEMAYSETPWHRAELPEFSGTPVADAVPGYWEDMTSKFQEAPFFGLLKLNPEYGLQRYPIAGTAPDMALPNIVGNFFYRRSFLCCPGTMPAAIWFSGVQNQVDLWLNGVHLGHHEGYSTAFEIPVPHGILKDGENTLVLSISNCALTGWNAEAVSGLTNRAACQYTGGITGDVELRFYPTALRDAAVLVHPDLREISVDITAEGPVSFTWAVLDGDTVLIEGIAEGSFSFPNPGLSSWCPEAPKLYTLELHCGDSALRRRFGVRRLTAEGTGLRLNGIPYYLRGICEHCYYPLTVHPVNDVAYYKNVIRKLKELGFNFIRFHTHIPAEAYMLAADELGILLEVESPNYTSLEEYLQIITCCRRHTSVVMYCCGNELEMDEPYIDHMEQCAQAVHAHTDALFSPMSALRGVEYFWQADKKDAHIVQVPFRRHPLRQERLNSFCDLYNSYTLAQTSYSSLCADPAQLDSWSTLYGKPRLSHETCIHGTYTDLRLADRYEGTPIGKTDMFSSLKQHLRNKGLLEKAPLYFRHSSQWQRRLRKHCFESTRLCRTLAGYDFLGPIDTHWHTFGYDVGMMNEFYELKPGETVRNVRMYNSPTVILTDLGTDMNFTAGEEVEIQILVSHFGSCDLHDAELNLRLTAEGKVLERCRVTVAELKNGEVSPVYTYRTRMPQVQVPAAMKLEATLDGGDTFAENEWELYLFPETRSDPDSILPVDDISEEDLMHALENGQDVVLLGSGPFISLPTSFQMSLAGRTSGNLATVIADHPALAGMPHSGFCGWQFRRLLEGGRAISFNSDAVPFDPIIDVASSHKYVIRQAAMFEARVLNGRLLVCAFRFNDTDPAARWLKNRLIAYAKSDDFEPAHTFSPEQISLLIHGKKLCAAENTNLAFNANDKAAQRKNRA